MINSNHSDLHLEKLNRNRIQLLQKMAQLRQELMTEVELDDEDRASDMSVREEIIVRIAELERKLAGIDHTLQTVRAGQYGICERCGLPIDPERLEVVPETTFCIGCKTLMERNTPRGRWLYGTNLGADVTIE